MSENLFVVSLYLLWGGASAGALVLLACYINVLACLATVLYRAILLVIQKVMRVLVLVSRYRILRGTVSYEFISYYHYSLL